MSTEQKRNKIVALLREIDQKTDDQSTAALYNVEYSAKSSRLGMLTVKRIYVLLTDVNKVNTGKQTAEQLRHRLRVDVLDIYDSDDPLDSRPLRSGELTALIGKLDCYRDQQRYS